MTGHQPRSRRPHHNTHVRTAANGSSDNTTSFDAVDVAACRLHLTSDGWYLDVVDPESIADARAADPSAAHRGESAQERPSSVMAVTIVLHHDDSRDAARMAADVLRSAIESHLDPDSLRVELTVVIPPVGRDG